jgi:hypothetical protein
VQNISGAHLHRPHSRPHVADDPPSVLGRSLSFFYCCSTDCSSSKGHARLIVVDQIQIIA